MIRLREPKKNLKLNVNLEYTGHAFFKRKNSNKHLPFNMTILFKIEEIENPLKIVFIWTNSSKFKELVKFNSIAIIIKKEICGYPQFPHVPSAHHCRCCHRLFFIFLEMSLSLQLMFWYLHQNCHHYKIVSQHVHNSAAAERKWKSNNKVLT